MQVAAREMAARQAQRIGQEVMLARSNLGLSSRRVAALSGVSISTERRVEAGDPGMTMRTAARVLAAVGMQLSARAFPSHEPSLRDTGQLALAERIRTLAAARWRMALEVPIEGRRSADVVLFGPDEIVLIEIERRLADFQAQYRAAVAKRDALQARHERPVRLVIAVEATGANRRRTAAAGAVMDHALPAGSRPILRALRTGASLGTDGLLWLRRSG